MIYCSGFLLVRLDGAFDPFSSCGVRGLTNLDMGVPFIRSWWATRPCWDRRLFGPLNVKALPVHGHALHYQ